MQGEEVVKIKMSITKRMPSLAQEKSVIDSSSVQQITPIDSQIQELRRISNRSRGQGLGQAR